MMLFEKRFIKQDTIDQSQQSSSHSRSPERLQQLRQAHRYQSEQNRKGKGIMSVEVQEQYNQTKQESLNDNYQAVIREIIKQRGGKSSSDSEISLGYQEGLRGGGKLKDHHWGELEGRLEFIKRNFNSLEKRRQRNIENGVDNDLDKKVQKQKADIEKDLDGFRKKVNFYEKKGDSDDSEWLSLLHNRTPENADDAAFLDGIQRSLGYIESGRQ